VVLKSGRTFEADVRHCRGSEGRPMSDEDISVKTLAQFELVFDRNTSQLLLAECWRIADYRSVDALSRKLAAA
jgi:hypothetical protein